MQDESGQPRSFDLETFLPYLLNQAAEATSRDFQAIYRAEHDLTRTQWRIIANLGKFGAMTAATICRISHMEKTKVSRAVAALEARGLLARRTDDVDRRSENLTLTDRGHETFATLGQRAIRFDQDLRRILGPRNAEKLEAMLQDLIRRCQADRYDERPPGTGGGV
ncbi:MarR family winged helix-turn-helix transcriptional regulator [Rubellimicrobium roseum]|uniref:Winged helix-turn-helix transcriptional regulator n=1 Tax=Rubellimicrobium roseum TaxID=687525 RepID=A0A5C4NKN3_9RHOB|nr:MarR family winged helix-turn-helix transcriptional regulator [Rubellimicrobium roseum]TNC73686.1 winged helix-turn-helix transcriptional regulator [Rubellimicrobium roseum]